MSTYRLTANLRFNQPVVIQQAITGGAQFSNTVPSDAKLVFEHGIWKYPAVAAAGAVLIPVGTALAPSSAVRLVAWMADFGATATWELHVKGAPDNATGEPYPAGDASLYREADIIVASGSGSRYASAMYGAGGGSEPAVILMPGQTLYIITTGAAGQPTVRFHLQPLTGARVV